MAVKRNQKVPQPLMRQVQIIVGLMIIIGIVLGLNFSMYFSLISAFFGVGLVCAGLTGNCGLAKILMFLQYNKQYNQENLTKE